MRVSKCRGCGAEIIWAQDQNGTTVPLNKVRVHGYSVGMAGEALNGMTAAEDKGLFYLSHFITCPNRAEFSGQKPRKG